MKMELEYKKGILFINVNGILNRLTTRKIYDYIIPVINKHKIKSVIYNMQNLKSIDEFGIIAIISTKKAVNKLAGNLYLCKVKKDILEKLKRVHINNSEEGIVLKKFEVQKGEL